MCPSPEPPPGLPQPAGGQRPERRPRGGQLPPSSTSTASKRHTVRGHHAASNSTAPYMREEAQPHHSACCLGFTDLSVGSPCGNLGAGTHLRSHAASRLPHHAGAPRRTQQRRALRAGQSTQFPSMLPLTAHYQRITRVQAQVSISDTAMDNKPVRSLSTVCYAVANSILAVTAPCNSQVVYFPTNIRRALLL